MITNTNELIHSRTKGSKNGIRLYQNTDGTWTELGKERRRKGTKTQPLSKEEKDHVIRSGNAALANRHRDEFTDDELRRVINRIRMNSEISKLDQKPTKKGKSFIDTYISGAGKVTKVLGVTVGAVGAVKKAKSTYQKDIKPFVNGVLYTYRGLT